MMMLFLLKASIDRFEFHENKITIYQILLSIIFSTERTSYRSKTTRALCFCLLLKIRNIMFEHSSHIKWNQIIVIKATYFRIHTENYEDKNRRFCISDFSIFNDNLYPNEFVSLLF